jgi:hypothetical protein
MNQDNTLLILEIEYYFMIFLCLRPFNKVKILCNNILIYI